MQRCLTANATRPTSRSVVVRSTNYQAPSYAPGATALDSLKRHTYVLSDRIYDDHSKIQAGSVSSDFLSSTILSPTASGGLKACVRNAFAFKSAAPGYEEMGAFSQQMDKALVNVTAHMLGDVEGKIAIEVDPRLSADTSKLTRRVELLVSLLKESGVPISKILFRIPTTYQGIEACAQLEKKGYHCLMINVFSFIQAQKAAEAGASVVKLNLGALQDFLREFPNTIRDPSGPREDSGFKSPVDPGLAMVASIYDMIKVKYPKTQVMVADIRSADDALAMAGVDYMLLNGKILDKLANTPTDAGYNDGLTGETSNMGEGVTRRMSPEMAKENFTEERAQSLVKGSLNEREFNDAMGIQGRTLTTRYLKQQMRFSEGMAGPLASSLVQGTE